MLDNNPHTEFYLLLHKPLSDHLKKNMKRKEVKENTNKYLTNEEVRKVLNHHNWTKEQSFEYLKSIGGEEEAKSLIDELYPQKEKN